jgi:hypothetical protein
MTNESGRIAPRDVYASAFDPCVALHLDPGQMGIVLKFTTLFFQQLVLPPMSLWDTHLKSLVCPGQETALDVDIVADGLQQFIAPSTPPSELFIPPVVFGIPKEAGGNPSRAFRDWYDRPDGPPWISGPFGNEKRLAIAEAYVKRQITEGTLVDLMGRSLAASLEFMDRPGLTEEYAMDSRALYSTYRQEMGSSAEAWMRKPGLSEHDQTVARKICDMAEAEDTLKRSRVLWGLSNEASPPELHNWKLVMGTVHENWNRMHAKALNVFHVPAEAFGISGPSVSLPLEREALLLLKRVPWSSISLIRQSTPFRAYLFDCLGLRGTNPTERFEKSLEQYLDFVADEFRKAETREYPGRRRLLMRLLYLLATRGPFVIASFALGVLTAPAFEDLLNIEAPRLATVGAASVASGFVASPVFLRITDLLKQNRTEQRHQHFRDRFGDFAQRLVRSATAP